MNGNVSQVRDKDPNDKLICEGLVRNNNEQSGTQMDESPVEKLKSQVVLPPNLSDDKKWRWSKSNLYQKYSPRGLSSFRRSTDSDSSRDEEVTTASGGKEYVDDSFVSFSMENQSPKNISAKTQWIKDQVASFIVKRIPSKTHESPEKGEGSVKSNGSVSFGFTKTDDSESTSTSETSSMVTEPVVMKLEYDIDGCVLMDAETTETPENVPQVAFVDKAGLSSLDEKEMAYLEFIEAKDGSKGARKDNLDDVNPVSMKKTHDSSKSHWIKDQVSNLLSKTKGHSKPAPVLIPEEKVELKEEPVSMKEVEQSDFEIVDVENPTFGDLHSSFQSKLNRLSTPNEFEIASGSPTFKRDGSDSFDGLHSPDMDSESSRLSGEEGDKTPTSKEDKRKLSSMLKMIGGTKTGDKVQGSEKQEDSNAEVRNDADITPEGETLRVPNEPPPRSSGSPTPSSPGSKKSPKGQKIKGLLNMPHQMSTDLTHLPSSSPTTGKSKGSSTASTSRKFPNPSKAFKIPKKLTFSELLHSQEGSHLTPDDEHKEESSESMSPSPVPRVEKEDDDSDDSLDPKELEALLKKDSAVAADREQPGSITYTQLWVTSVLFYGFLLSSPSPFITGAVYGFLFMYLLGCFIIWLLCPSGKSYQQYKMELKEYLAEPEGGSPIKQTTTTSTLDPTSFQKPRDLKGWVHFTLEYEQQSFSLSETKDVFVVLQGESLHIFRCKPQSEGETLSHENLPKVKKGLGRSKKRRKQLELKKMEPLFVFEKEHKIDLTKCTTTIKPLDLPMRRIWNRKYPIELTIPAGAMHTIEPSITFEELQLNFEEYFRDRSSEGATNTESEVFYLLPNTGREKEDWFYRIQLCIKPLKHQITIENYKKGKITTKPATSYPHYAVEVITESQATLQKGKKGVKLEPHLAWFNALLGRAFWDVWHEPYWYAKVRQKIQHRLNKLNTPPFIKDIFIRDLHLGHSLPIIHKGSLPVLDEYGVWVDLQVTYKGEFTLTLETQLNVDYYAQLVNTIIKQQEQLHTETTDGVRVKAHIAKQEEATPEGNVEEVVSELQEQLPEIYLEAIDTVEIDEEDLTADQDADAMLNDPKTKAFLQSKTGKRVAGVVGWLAKSKIAKRVAETEFAKKAYEKAYEKFQKMPIILKVEVQNLKGTLAVNMPPPPTNRLWFGFRGNPAVLITAQPRIGERQVRLTYLTDWIERKLKEEFKKVFVLPAMQDFSIKIMNSRLQELFPDRPLT